MPSGEALARIHAIEVDEALARMLRTITPEALVHESWNSYKALNLPQPMIDFTARWLLQNLPSGARQTLVHGDFRNANLMIDDTGIRAVLDWELAHRRDTKPGAPSHWKTLIRGTDGLCESAAYPDTVPANLPEFFPWWEEPEYN